MKIVVLAGGVSPERDVSLASGSMIYKALKKNGHQAILLDVYLGYEGETENIFERELDWTAQAGIITEDAPDLETVRKMRPNGDGDFFGPNVLALCQSADMVFMALHGANGEDGRIQACFELLGIPYTGTGFVSSAIAMDKGITKDIFKAWEIPAPKGILLKKGETEGERIPCPCVVKACRGGSSVGVGIARDDAEYEAAKEEAFRYDDEVVVEEYIAGREFAVAVMDGGALPVIEMAAENGFYDYRSKYQAGSAVETCPAKLPPEKTKELQAMAERVFRALRLKGYARMDFRMDGEGRIFCLEANTLPGMTETSLLPQEAAAQGIGFEELCERILELAFEL